MKKGATRFVFIFHNLVIKIPSLYSYKNFLNGLLANMQEVQFSKCTDFKDKLCPIKFHMPLGLMVVMPKAIILTKNEISRQDLETFCRVGQYKIPAEPKCDSFGYLNGKLVVVDYG